MNYEYKVTVTATTHDLEKQLNGLNVAGWEIWFVHCEGTHHTIVSRKPR